MICLQRVTSCKHDLTALVVWIAWRITCCDQFVEEALCRESCFTSQSIPLAAMELECEDQPCGRDQAPMRVPSRFRQYALTLHVLHDQTWLILWNHI